MFDKFQIRKNFVFLSQVLRTSDFFICKTYFCSLDVDSINSISTSVIYLLWFFTFRFFNHFFQVELFQKLLFNYLYQYDWFSIIASQDLNMFSEGETGRFSGGSRVKLVRLLEIMNSKDILRENINWKLYLIYISQVITNFYRRLQTTRSPYIWTAQ